MLDQCKAQQALRSSASAHLTSHPASQLTCAASPTACGSSPAALPQSFAPSQACSAWRPIAQSATTAASAHFTGGGSFQSQASPLGSSPAGELSCGLRGAQVHHRPASPASTVTGFSAPGTPAQPAADSDVPSNKKAPRKGHLSMFLSGKLDTPPPPRAPSPPRAPASAPAVERGGPAAPPKTPWQRPSAPAAASIGEILAEASTQANTGPPASQRIPSGMQMNNRTSRSSGKVQMSLGDFVCSTATTPAAAAAARRGSADAVATPAATANSEAASAGVRSSGRAWRKSADTASDAPSIATAPSLSQIMQAEKAAAAKPERQAGVGRPAVPEAALPQRDRANPWGKHSDASPVPPNLPSEDLFAATTDKVKARKGKASQWWVQEGVQAQHIDTIVAQEATLAKTQSPQASALPLSPTRRAAIQACNAMAAADMTAHRSDRDAPQKDSKGKSALMSADASTARDQQHRQARAGGATDNSRRRSSAGRGRGGGRGPGSNSHSGTEPTDGSELAVGSSKSYSEPGHTAEGQQQQQRPRRAASGRRQQVQAGPAVSDAQPR